MKHEVPKINLINDPKKSSVPKLSIPAKVTKTEKVEEIKKEE